MKKIIRARIEPSCAESFFYAVQLFGSDRVKFTVCLEPLIVFNIDAEEFLAGKDLLKEIDIILRVESEVER